jgi:hypothetical protein
MVFTAQAYQSSQYVVPGGRHFSRQVAQLFRSKMNVQSACALNTRYICNLVLFFLKENN